MSKHWLVPAMLALSLVAGQVYARVQVLSESDASLDLLDLNTVKKAGARRSLVMITIYPYVSELPDSGGKKYQSVDAETLIDCNKHQYALQRMNVYDPEHHALGRKDFRRLTWKPLKAGFPVARAGAAACGRPDPKARSFESIDSATRDYLERRGKQPD